MNSKRLLLMPNKETLTPHPYTWGIGPWEAEKTKEPWAMTDWRVTKTMVLLVAESTAYLGESIYRCGSRSHSQLWYKL